MGEQKITVEDAAKRLGVTRNTILNMAQRGLLRIEKRPFGRRRLFVSLTDVERLEKEFRVIGGHY